MRNLRTNPVAGPAPEPVAITAQAAQALHRATGGAITVLVPAHNESAAIIETLDSLAQQTYRPDRVIVVADNCTDNTDRLGTGPWRRGHPHSWQHR